MATDIKKEIERLRDEIREHIRELGVHGPVSVERFDGKRLPYAKNLVNLVVAEDLGGVTMEEAMRVLVPGGAVYFTAGRSSYLDGPWPDRVGCGQLYEAYDAIPVLLSPFVERMSSAYRR